MISHKKNENTYQVNELSDDALATVVGGCGNDNGWGDNGYGDNGCHHNRCHPNRCGDGHGVLGGVLDKLVDGLL